MIDPKPASRAADPHVVRTVRLVLIGLLVVLVAYYAFRSARQSHRSLKNDFGIYYQAGLVAAQGGPIYTEEGPDGFLYTLKGSPTVAAACVVMSPLPAWAARFGWVLVDTALMLLAMHLFLRLLPDDVPNRLHVPGVTFGFWVAAAAVALSLRYVMNQYQAGQTTAWWVAASMIALWASLNNRPWLAGAALALGVLIKLLPIALLPWLIFCAPKRRIELRALGGLVVGGVLLGLVFPSLVVSWSWTIEQLGIWPQHLLATERPEQVWRVQNQSVYSMLARLFMDNYSPLEILRLDQAVVRNLWLGLSLTTAAAVYAWIFLERRRGRVDGWSVAAHLSVLFIFITTFNPHAWRYNFILVAAPYALIVAGLLAPGSGWTRRSVRIALLVIAYVLQGLPHGGPQWSGIDWFQALGARLWATLLLGVGVVMTLQAVRARPADAQVNRSQAVPT